MAHRAREHVQARQPRFDTDRRAQREVTERFLAAAAGGDVEALLAVLAPDVVLITDGGGKAKAALRPIAGADKVARFVAAVSAEGLENPGPAGRAGRRQRRPGDRRVGGHRALHVDVPRGRRDGRIQQVLLVRNPDKLAGHRRPPRSSPSRLRRVTQPPREPAEFVERALCVLAHPDDVDFGSAGTVATWTAAGTEVIYCIVTDGDAGGFDETPRDADGSAAPGGATRPPRPPWA